MEESTALPQYLFQVIVCIPQRETSPTFCLCLFFLAELDVGLQRSGVRGPQASHTFCFGPEPLPSSPSGSYQRRRSLCSPPLLEKKMKKTFPSDFSCMIYTSLRFVFYSVYLCFFWVSFFTAVVDVIRVAVLLLLLLVRVTTCHDEVTGPGYVSFLCGQEVKSAKYNNKIQCNKLLV